MSWKDQEWAYTKVHIKYKCPNDNCDTKLEATYFSEDWSPRVDGECTTCKEEYSLNVSSLTVLSRVTEEVYR